MALKHYKFFNSRGNQITPEIDNGVFRFNIFFDQVSTGLFSSAHIFIFEEILKEKAGLNIDNKKKGAYTPLLIKIMRYIRDWNGPIRKEKLNVFFTTLSIDIDYVGNFINKNNNLILATFDGDNVYYSLTNKGENYLTDYDEKEQIFWLDNERKVVELTRPRANYNVNDNEDSYMFFKWRVPSQNDKNIFVYYIDNADTQLYYEGDKSIGLDNGKHLPAIVPVYSSDLDPDNNSNPNWKRWFLPYTLDNGNGDSFLNPADHSTHRVISSDIDTNSKPFQLNIALNSDTEGIFIRILDLFIVRNVVNPNTGKVTSLVNKFAEVVCHGEVVAEDERFKLLLENFGRTVDENDSYVFRDTDVDEHLPDYIKINEKRKELLLVGEEIYNYIGSYKAFVNAMKFFGYQDLRLKEYFVNTILSSPSQNEIYYAAVEIPLDLQVDFEFDENKDFNKLIFGSLIDNKIYQKTSRFGLFYDINKVTGELDDYGFPIVEDEFAFTNEEILLKLYGLKRVLQKYYLPHHARIIDITGEGIYFAKFKLNSWIDKNPIITLNYINNPDFVAEPLVGEIKPLDRLLNIFKINIEEINDVLFLNEDDLIESVINKSLMEFIKNEDTSFVFDKEVSLDVIKRFYPDYWSLKTAVYNNLKNSTCPITHTNYSEDTLNPIFTEKSFVYLPDAPLGPTGYYNDVVVVNKNNSNILYKSFEHSIKMFGQPVLIKMLPFNITWDDMNVRFDYLENELGPVDINESLFSQLSSEEVNRYDWTNISIPDRIKLKRLIWSSSRLFCWDNIGYFGTQWMQWYINHSNHNYCFKEEGIVSKTKEILVFLPHTGKYDVTLTLRDYTNFPRITTKRKYIEVKKEIPDFIAMGRYVDKGTYWDDYSTTTWNDYIGLWNTTNYCTKKTLWDDADIMWDDMNYSTYQSQFFTKDIYESEVIDYNTDNYTIKLKGLDFLNNYNDYNSQKKRNILVLERYPEEVPTRKGVSIVSIVNKTITLNGVYDIRIGEHLNLYQQYTTNQMVVSINPGNVDVLTEYADTFFIGKPFNLLNGSTLEEETYISTDVYVDYTKNIAHLNVEDDGSLYDIPHNKIQFRNNDNVFRITNCIIDRENNLTKIDVIDSNSYLRNIINTDLNTYNAEWGIFSGRFIFDILDVSNDSNNTLIRIKSNEDICNINTSFNAKWALDYDYDYAERFASSTNYTWGNLKDCSLDDLLNQTWNTIEYHNNSITGFKIREFSRIGWIKLNGEKLSFSIPNTVPLDSMLNYMATLLSDNELYVFNNFHYNVIDNLYIQATSKTLGSNSYVTIESSGDVDIQKDSFPDANFEEWNRVFYKGYNNPADWNYLNYDNKDNPWLVDGSFNFTDTFITSEDMVLPISTTLYIVFSKAIDISINNLYEWELWDEQNSILLMRSDYRYLLWNFTQRGIYTVKLKFTDSNSNEIIYTKRSWIKII